MRQMVRIQYVCGKKIAYAADLGIVVLTTGFSKSSLRTIQHIMHQARDPPLSLFLMSYGAQRTHQQQQQQQPDHSDCGDMDIGVHRAKMVTRMDRGTTDRLALL